MATDVFDTLERPKTKDVFDELETPDGDVFDAVLDSAAAVEAEPREGVWSTGVDLVRDTPVAPYGDLPQVSAQDAPAVVAAANVADEETMRAHELQNFRNQLNPLEDQGQNPLIGAVGSAYGSLANQAAEAIDFLEDDDEVIGEKAGDPKNQRRLDVVRQRLSELNRDPGNTRTSEFSELENEALALSRPLREDTFAGKLARSGASAKEDAAKVPGVAGSISRAVGNVAAFAPSMAAGGPLAGLAVGTAQAVTGAESEGRTAEADALRAAGVTDETQIEEASKAAGLEAASHAALTMPAYLLAGRVGAVAASRIMAGASRTATVAAQTIAATTANVAAGSLIRTLEGGEAMPNLEQFTMDALWGVIHGAGVNASEKAKSRARGELASRGWAQHEIDNPSGMPERFRSGEEQPVSSAMRAPEKVEGFSPEFVGEGEMPPRPGADLPPPDLTAPERRLGPGAANVEEFAPQTQIGAKNASIDAQRTARGLPPLMSELRGTFKQTWERVESAIESNPDLPRDLVDDVLSGERKAITEDDQAALLWRVAELHNRRNTELQRASDENATPEERAQAEADFNAVEKEYQRAEEADRKAGTTESRALSIRRIMVNEDYTFADMSKRATLSKKEPLTLAETQKIKAESEKFQQADKALQQRERQLEEDAPVDPIIKAIEAEARKDPAFTPEVRSLAERISARLEKAADSALKRLRAKGFLQLGSAPDPTIIADMVIYGTAKITKGLLDFGRWSAAMVRDLGRGVEPHLRDVWDAANLRIDEAAAAGGKNKAKVKDAVTKAPAIATAASIGATMRARVDAGEKLTDLRGMVQKLTETLVRGGIKERGALVDAVHDVLKGIDPAITRRQASDAISGYGDFKPLNPDVVKAEVRDLKGQLQQVAKMEDILAGKPLQKTGVERRAPSDEERALIKQVNELARQHGVKVTDPATQLRSILGGIETRLTNRIKDLRAEIAKGALTVKTRTTPATSPKIEALRAELAKAEADHEAVFGKRQMTDEQRLRDFKTRAESRIKDLEDRMARGDFAPRPKRPPLDLSRDPAAVKAAADKERVVREFTKQQAAWKAAQRSAGRKVIDFAKEMLASTRTLITSADLSAPFRQGGVFAIGDLVFNPRRLGRQLLGMLRSTTTERGFQQQESAIRLRPNAALYEKSGLYLADIEGSFTGREENMRTNLAEKIPVVGRVVRGSNRAYAGFLNRQRADAFDAFVEAMGGKDKVTPQDAQFLAKGINDLTGRGEATGSMTGAMNFLARYLFSPRFLLSRFKTLLGAPVLRGAWTGRDAVSLRARRKIAVPYLKFAAALNVLYGLSALNGEEVEKDPRSSDFGKIKIGDTRLDPLAGLAQVATFLGRTVTGETNQGGNVKDQKRSETLLRFARTKLAPVPGIVGDYFAEQTIDRQEPTALGSLRRLTVPISYTEAPEIYEEHGATKATLLQMLGLLGFGLQHY